MRLLHLFEDWYDQDEDRTWEPQTHRIPAGTRLYHGTSADFDPGRDGLDTPVWVTDSFEVARHYASPEWRKDDGHARVYEFETSEDLNLWHITSREDFDEFEDYTGHEMGGSTAEMAEVVCQAMHLDGWAIPDNYPEGGDIMLCSDHALRLVGVKMAEGLTEGSASPADEFIQRFTQLNLPVEVRMTPLSDTKIEINSMFTQDRGLGHGRAALQAITQLADQLGVTLELLPRSAVEYGWDTDGDFIDALSQYDLEDWYRRYGFRDVPNRASGHDGEYDEYLVRAPRGFTEENEALKDALGRDDGTPATVTPVSVHDAYRGEAFGSKTVQQNGQVVAAADINILGDEVVIQHIQVRQGFERQGYATMLVDDLFREFPNKKIMISNTTDDGTGLFRQYRPDADGRIYPRST